MRSTDIQEVALYSYISPEQRVPADHQLRPIREMVNAVLRTLSPEFNKIYSIYGRPSIPPERLLRCLLLQVLYTVRSERMMMEQLDYNLLYRWFVGLNRVGMGATADERNVFRQLGMIKPCSRAPRTPHHAAGSPRISRAAGIAEEPR
jgi:transposase